MLVQISIISISQIITTALRIGISELTIKVDRTCDVNKNWLLDMKITYVVYVPVLLRVKSLSGCTG